MTHYTATYQSVHSRWELRTPDSLVAVAYNVDLHPGDGDGAAVWVAQAVAEFDAVPDYVGVTSDATPTVHASTSTEVPR